MVHTESRAALVSGGARGIGRATVRALARDGFDVAFCYRRDVEAARELEKCGAEFGVRVVGTRADVADATAARRWVEEAQEALGPAEAAVTCAGITRDSPLVLMTDEQWRDVIGTNLDGVYHVCRAVVFGMMKRRRGTIVNVSSVVGVSGRGGQTNYSASKAGIIGFSRSLAKEVGRVGIRVNAVAPGFIDTGMTAAMTDKAREELLDAISLRRMGRAEEVADLVSYLVSDRAAYITGSVLRIDGGLTL
jgi:3-oxoacyl-[acyl-carrier protein] reductase